MIGHRFVAACGLACLVIVSMTGPAVAQSEEGCGAEISMAETRYQNGAFEEALRLASECLNRSGVSSEQAVRAYRMLALAHIRRDELQAARTAIVSLFGVKPHYMPDAIEEPPVYTAMVSLVRRELQLGPSSMPARRVEPLPVSSALLDRSARPGLEETASDLPSERIDEDEPQRSFFQRPGTWMIGGIMIGSSVRSGDHVRGIGIGGLGMGAGRRFTGVGIGGLGVGGGDALEGIMIGGVAVVSGGRLTGISIGGLGVGAGRHLSGLSFGGLVVGSGRSIRGVAIGGLGVGTRGNIAGGAFALLGVGAQRNVTGLTVAGLGIGVGNHLRGLHVAGVGTIASRLSGVVVSPIVTSERAAGGLIAPLYARIADDGQLSGVSFSAFNHVQGRQYGLTVGLLNVASTLQGVQLGLLNYAGNNPLLLRLLPGINLHF